MKKFIRLKIFFVDKIEYANFATIVIKSFNL
jgi:hypothetical protein